MTAVMTMPVYAVPVEGETFLPMPQMIRQSAATQPDKPAIHDGDRVVPWGALSRQVNRIANRLIAGGVQPGDMVAGLSENTADYVALYLGVLAAGACMVPLSGMAAGDSLRLMIDDCESRWLFVSARNRALAEPLRGSLQQVAPDRMIGLDFGDTGWQRFEEWLAAAPDTAPEVAITPDHPFNVIYSSGTTGTPKGIVHDHRMRARQINRLCAAYGLNGDAVTLVSTPLYSNTTLVSALPTLAFGGTLVLMAKFDARGFLELAERYRVTHAMLVPVQYERILALPDFDRFDLSSFQIKLSTSAPLRSNVIRDALARWPGRLYEIYGLTEGGVSTTLDASSFPDKLDSVGKPAEGVEVRIIDEQGCELPQGEIGEIVGRAWTATCTRRQNAPRACQALAETSPDRQGPAAGQDRRPGSSISQMQASAARLARAPAVIGSA
jgi:long-chain acyl-CoA synthetase